MFAKTMADAFLGQLEAQLAYKEAGKKALAAELKMLQEHSGYPLTRWDLDDPPVLLYSAKPKQSTKCHSCGSREFREHQGSVICSYCRSGA